MGFMMAGFIAYVVLFVGVLSAFLHIINCLLDERWVFLIAGLVAFPVAIVHGLGIWFGVW